MRVFLACALVLLGCGGKDARLIGSGDASFVEVYRAERALHATDLAFHPERPNELWILRRELASPEPCDSVTTTDAGCAALQGSIAVVFGDGSVETYTDPNAWHFMRRPPAFAFGAPGTFASVGEHRTGNLLDSAADYIGPTLWSSALLGIVPGCETSPMGCFTVEPAGGNGSHLDMLHESPYAMGIAHERDNVYWVFNGNAGAIDRYDFHHDHGPGAEDHSDGELHRYAPGSVTRVPDVPSHMAFHDGALYVADSGGGRVLELDTDSGSPAGAASPNNDNLAVCELMAGADLREVVEPGTLTTPSGLEIYDGVLYVTDHATSRIHAFDLDGDEIRSVDTGLPSGSLAGFAVGPDEKAYFVDMPNAVVYRIDPK